ncbi:MFS transporter [Rhodobacterales bacterium HKCCE3408]|nr:MFS transporter [Rhodobacterales bacterium HKCCE3408]
MAPRWRVLAVLFLVRTAMAFQFQLVAALSPLYQDHFGASLADVGVLIGIYLAPGIVFALPGGTVARWMGDRRIVLLGLVLMIAGGLVIAALPGWTAQIGGRIVAGIGGVIVNVIMTKIITDWFAGREISTAMAIYVNSWPLGIAVALLVLPPVAAAVGITGAAYAVAGFCAVGWLLMATAYRDPPVVSTGAVLTGAWPTGPNLRLLIAAGLIWALFNVALGMVFGFGPALLAERGWDLAAASAQTSLVLWGVVVAGPIGGMIADRSGRRDLVIVVSLAAFAALLLVAAERPENWSLFLALGLAAGLCPGAIMSLPSDALSPPMRATGMGLFFTLYYLMFFIAPPVAGAMSEASGSAASAFRLGVGCLVACVVLLAMFRAGLARMRMAAPA